LCAAQVFGSVRGGKVVGMRGALVALVWQGETVWLCVRRAVIGLQVGLDDVQLLTWWRLLCDELGLLLPLHAC